MKATPLILILLSVLLLDCNPSSVDFENLKNPVLTGYAALPLGHATYTMQELIEDASDSALNFEEDSSSLITFYYRDSVSFKTDTKIVELQDISHTAQIDLPATPATASSQAIPVNTELTFSFNAQDGEKLSAVHYESGFIDLELVSTTVGNIIYGITVNSTVDQATENPVFFSGNLAGGATSSNNRDISGYKTNLTNPGDSNVFTVAVDFTVMLDAGESISAGDQLELSIDFRDQVFDLVYGYFSQDTIQGNGSSVDVSFFNNFGNSGLKFKAPEIILDFHNSYGIPLGIDMSQIYGIDTVDGTAQQIDLTGTVTNSPQVIAASASPGTQTSSQISINASNSSIQDLLEATPSVFGFDLLAIANPKNDTSVNFVSSENEFNADLTIKLPLEVSMKDVKRDLKFDLGSGLDFNGTEAVTIRIASENSLPFLALLEVEFRDSFDQTLHTVPVVTVLESPYLDIDGIVTEPRVNVADIPLGEEGIAAMRQSGTQLIVSVYLNTPGNQGSRDLYYKILSDYYLDINVGVAGELNAEL